MLHVGCWASFYQPQACLVLLRRAPSSPSCAQTRHQHQQAARQGSCKAQPAGAGVHLKSGMAAAGAAAANAKPKPTEPANPGAWRLLSTHPAELRLEFTLPTGQSFRWQQTGGGEYTGVMGQRVVRLRQLEGGVAYQVVARGSGACPSEDEAVLRDYFNLDTSLVRLAAQWCAADARFAAVHPVLQGARMLRQDPVECLFQFVCSSNNHISRIHRMVERLCACYGTPLHTTATAASAAAVAAGSPADGVLHLSGGGRRGSAAAAEAPPVVALQAGAEPAITTAAALGGAGEGTRDGCADAGEAAQGRCYYAFPTLEQLAEATEEALRQDGFGYRAKFIVGSVAALREKPGGGEAWLLGLRSAPYAEAVQELSTLPGIGPKVAACICLFSLDKHEAIPVDTHVWQLACRYYTPHLRGRSLTKRVHQEVQGAFVARFGPYAGWAHNTLFISELASIKGRLVQGPSATSKESLASEEATAPIAAAATAAAGPKKTGVKRRRPRKGLVAGAADDSDWDPPAAAAVGAAGTAQGGKRRRAANAGAAAAGEAGGQRAMGGWRRKRASSLAEAEAAL